MVAQRSRIMEAREAGGLAWKRQQFSMEPDIGEPHLSQKALADTIGISVSYVSMLERAQRSPPLATLEKMARALKVTPAVLLGGR